MVRLPGADQELRGDLVRPGRADRFRLVALGRARHPRVGDQTRDGRGRHRRFRRVRRAVHVRNDYMVKDFGGVALPEGDPPHRYVFVVHVLDVESLGVSDEISPAMAGFNLRFHNHRPCRAHPRVRLLIFNSARRSGQDRSRGGWPAGPSSHGDISARWRLSGEVCAG